ncbi:unnamed protein product [Dovyalis caffra]|uniref:oligopeptidase A n=1 Tax=Dovyalis caffra TaxID=77055 RepID=A0AAV1R5H9_9ROSI|nr:unnamed protein product [Dovyalis caffra]
MATVDKAEELIEELCNACRGSAIQDMEDLEIFAKGHNAVEANQLRHWDINFWSERLRESRYDINDEELRAFFPMSRVIDGLFSLAKMLFAINIYPADGLAPVWNNDVRFYCVKNLSDVPIAYFYFDPYSRPSGKRSGAWVDLVVGRSRILSRDATSCRLPVVHIVCNQTPPLAGKPSLMTFREVEALFHEFGHALQHMLTIQDEGLVSGIKGIEWDAVELPSQFMEHWCYQREKDVIEEGLKSTSPDVLLTQNAGKLSLSSKEIQLESSINSILAVNLYLSQKGTFKCITVTAYNLVKVRDTLMSIAKHYKTGESLPEEICLKLLAARTFRAGSELLRQDCNCVERDDSGAVSHVPIFKSVSHAPFSSLSLKIRRYVDLELHTKYVPGGLESVYEIDQRVDTYAAGYYCYQWAEVLAADAFSAFEEAGLNNEKVVKQIGIKFRETVLALGGGKSPLQVFIDFRGREPSPEPLLRYYGLKPSLAAA